MKLQIFFIYGIFGLIFLIPIHSFSQLLDSEITDEQLIIWEEYLIQADIYFIEENYEDAIIFYDKALDIDPQDFQSLYGKAQSLTNLGQYKESFLYFAQAIDIDPTDTEALNGMAFALYSDEQLESAIYYYELILDVDPQDIAALNGMAIILEAQGNQTEAISFYEKAIELSESSLEEPEIETTSPPVSEQIEPIFVPEVQTDNDFSFDNSLLIIIIAFIAILGVVIITDLISKRKLSSIVDIKN